MPESTDGGAPGGAPPGAPSAAAPPAADVTGGGPPAPRSRPRIAPLSPAPPADVAPPPPETSSRSVQSVMLGLGALVLGVAAIAFVGVLSELDPWGRLVILLAVALLALAVPVPLAARGLTATAEAIAVVGLVLIVVAAYALWTTGAVGALPADTYAGLAAAVSGATGYGYHRLSRLPVPRFAGLVLLQGALPLLAYGAVTRPTGWALVMTLVATQNAVLGHFDLRLDLPASRRHLRYLGWALHGAALMVAAGFAVAGLVAGHRVAAAVGAAATLLLVAAVGQVGALTLRRAPLPEVAAGALTLAFIGGLGRVLTVALPGRALLPVAAVVGLVGVATLRLPARARRGPAAALAVAAGVLGAVVAALSLRAGLATVTAVLPPWSADLDAYPRQLADAVADTGWQLPTAAIALMVAGAVAVPPPARREVLVVTGALTALAVPAGYGLGPMITPWVPLVAVAAISVTALDAPTRRAAVVHLVAAGALTLAAAGASLAQPLLTATILAALAIVAFVVAWGRPRAEVARWVTGWAAGTVLLAFPGAVACATVTLGLDTSRVLTASAAAVCVSVGYAAWVRLREDTVPAPIVGGAGLAAGLLLATSLAAPGAAMADRAVALLLAAGAALVALAPRLDAVRPKNRRYDASQLAAATVTAGVVATLARVISLVLPAGGAQTGLAVGALLILSVALGIRALPADLRRGPVVGLAVFGVVVAGLAGAAAVVGAARTIAVRWSGDLAGWPPEPTWWGVSWAAPFALVAVAVAARMVLPPSVRYDVTAGLVLLATVGAPPTLGTAWWTPTALSLAVGGGYALSTTLPARAGSDPRAVTVRATAAAVLGLYALVTAAGQRWLLAAAFGVITVTAGAVAGLIAAQRDVTAAWPRVATARRSAAAAAQGTAAARPDSTAARRDMSGGLSDAIADQRRIGGTAVAVALLATPAGLAALASHLGHPTQILITASLAGSSLGLAVLAVARHRISGFLGYGTVGIAAATTATALFTLATPHPPGVYAAAAVLLGVLAELVRADAGAPGRAGRAPGTGLNPPTGAVAAAAVPSVVALVGVAPALSAVLIEPYQVLAAPWQGPPDALVSGPRVGAPSVLATLLLTLAAALAAVGFGGAVTRQTAPVIAPGLAVTMLIAPAALGVPWPGGTVAVLAVAAVAALIVALTPPPPPGYRARPLRITRRAVLVIAVAAGGAGLAGGLADPVLTWVAFAVVVVTGGVAALAGRTAQARLVGWWSALLGAHLLALDTALLIGLPRARVAFPVLVVAAVALAVLPRLPRFRDNAAPRQLWVVEWVGGYLGLIIALTLAVDAPADLAALLVGTGVVIGAAALRPGRSDRMRRALLWGAAVSEIAAWWIIMWLADVGLVEAYSLPFALLALGVGVLESRHRPGLSSWAVYGPALVAALGPSLLVVVLAGEAQPARQAGVLLGGVAAILIGSRRAQRAPLIVGALVTAIGALHLLSLAGPWLVLIPIGLVLLILGANNERRQRDLERLRGAYSRMR